MGKIIVTCTECKHTETTESPKGPGKVIEIKGCEHCSDTKKEDTTKTETDDKDKK